MCSEIQLKSPNWLFGQRKYEDSVSTLKATSEEIKNGDSKNEKAIDDFRKLYWTSSGDDANEEDIFQR